MARRTRVAAYGLLVDEQRILLCRIADGDPRHDGLWTLPGGGIEFGETPEAAMVREVEEETGLIVEPRGLADVNSILIEREEDAFHGIRVIYYIEIVGGELRNEIDGSTDECRWWSADQLPEMVELAKVGVQLAFSASAPAPNP